MPQSKQRQKSYLPCKNGYLVYLKERHTIKKVLIATAKVTFWFFFFFFQENKALYVNRLPVTFHMKYQLGFTWNIKPYFLWKTTNKEFRMSSTSILNGVLRVNPCLADWIKMPHPLLISSQSDYLIWLFDRNAHITWQTVQIQVSWLLQKPTDLDLHCLLRQGMSCSAREELRTHSTFLGKNKKYQYYYIALDKMLLFNQKSRNIFSGMHWVLIRCTLVTSN